MSTFGAFTVTRASTKNVLGSNGLYQSVANNTPAFEFNTDGTYRGLLVEPGATNLLLRSQEFQTSWTVSAVSISANATIAPDGTSTADKLVEDATSNAHAIQQSVTVANATVYTYSCFAKKGERKYLRLIGGTGFTASVNFDLDDGSFTITAGTPTVAVQALPDGWYRCSVTATTSATSITPNISMTTTAGGTGAYAGDGTSGIFIWQAQLETGSVATSYIVTTGSTATRSADAISLTSASSLIGQTGGGTLFVEVAWRASTAEQTLLTLRGATNANRVQLTHVGGTNQMIMFITANNVIQTPLTQQSSVGYSGNIKFAIGYAQDNSVLVRNGSVAFTDTSVDLTSLATLNEIYIGSVGGGLEFANMHIRSVALFPTRLSNAQLIAITS